MSRILYINGQILGNCIFVKDAEGVVIPGYKGRCADFVCKCGNVFTAHIHAVKWNLIQYCGVNCIERKKAFISKKATHGHVINNKKTSEYSAWISVKHRCYKEKNCRYKYYGAKGVKMCDRWLNSFENFIADMGFKPSPLHSLDRFPNKEGNYEPGNCRWATIEQQARNKSNTHNITYKGKTLCLTDWAKELGISKGCLEGRISVMKWSVERAFTEPVNKKNKKIAA